MAKSIRDSKKRKLGRPVTTGSGAAQIVRMHGPQIQAIDQWIEVEGLDISRPEAIRRLVQIGLSTVNRSPASPSKSAAARAAQLAEAEIDRHVKGAPDADVRKRKVLKGPSMFREVRIDRAKRSD